MAYSFDENAFPDYFVKNDVWQRRNDEFKRRVFFPRSAPVKRRLETHDPVVDRFRDALSGIWTIFANEGVDLCKIVCGAVGPDDFH